MAIRSNKTDANWSEHVDLQAAVRPEGHGLTAFVATLPLRPGYKLDYEIVDRWSGHDKARIKKMTMEVKSRGIIETAMGKRDSYEVSIRPEDRSFEIRESVLAQGLHWPLRMTYFRGAAKTKSEVLAIAVSETSSGTPATSSPARAGVPRKRSVWLARMRNGRVALVHELESVDTGRVRGYGHPRGQAH